MVTDIRNFLGLASYYHRFMEGFSSIAAPLTALTKKKVKFYGAETCKKSFQELKDRLTSSPVLTLTKRGENYTVYYDASRIGFGCVFMRGGNVIIYVSRQLKEMNTIRMTIRRLEDGRVQDEVSQGGLDPQGVRFPQGAQVPPQGDNVPIMGGDIEVSVVHPDMISGEIREALLALARAMTTYVNRGIETRVSAVERTMTSRLRDFVRMNPPKFLGSKVAEDPQ
ncbi:uncharacterized protein LOC107016644 [Solanum pennellii]|uniref:Uncharacterized protein LOC107016644 n=1 Tax=Solanum pennellii TaxID=28526 RepID=A0ABM1GKW7_SOLPN|nr:uncharacterized protein LOC107016644 [Solanum pennellii]